MRIVSTFLPAEPSSLTSGGPAIVMALDTLVDDKSLVVGLAQGTVEGPDLASVRVSEVGNAVIERCVRHHDLNYPQAATVIAGVAHVGSAVKRVRQVLAKAPPQAFVLLLCADGKVYDAAFTALGVDLKSAHQKAQ